jgi:ketosteroid isomerase-like protein
MRGHTEAVAFNLRVTEVFRRDGDEWKLVHRHADSLLPESENQP